MSFNDGRGGITRYFYGDTLEEDPEFTERDYWNEVIERAENCEYDQETMQRKSLRLDKAAREAYDTVGQRSPKGAEQQTCLELQRSLVQDSRDAAAGILAGRYQAITHETVLRRLERSERISVESHAHLQGDTAVHPEGTVT